MRRVAVILMLSLLIPGIGTPGAAGYEVVAVTDGGTIRGKVAYTGPPPPPRKEIRAKNPEVCGSGVFEVPQMAIATDKGVGDVIVYLKDVEKGKALAKPAKPPEIVNHKCSFEPHIQAFPVGDVVIVNSDPVLHNTHGYFGRLTTFNVALPNQGQRISKPIKKAGVMKIDCDAHGWMLGWAYVADNPYYAVTGKDGTFTIKDVPSGSYTLVAWQEFTGPVEIPVTVKAKGVETVAVDLAKKK